MPQEYRAQDDDVIHWRYAHGDRVEGYKYDEILGKYDGQITSVLSTKLYNGLTEAMTNAKHHAYIRVRPDGLGVTKPKRDWWMFSQERDNQLSVVFCDLGIGIPGSLPIQQPILWKRILLGGKMTDGDIIKEAIADSYTRTGKHYRGKGLGQLVNVVAKESDSVLLIYSNKGCYTCTSGSETVRNFIGSVQGTVIFWRLTLRKEAP